MNNTDIMSVAPLRLRPRTICRRLVLSLRHDPLARIVSPSDALRLADQILTCTAIANSGTRLWCSVALEPLATLILAASAAGSGQGTEWVRTTSRTLHAADRYDPAWDHVETTCSGHPTTSGPMRTALTRLRLMEPGQRRSVTSVMVTAAGALRQHR